MVTLFGLWLWYVGGSASETEALAADPSACAQFDHEHTAWSGLLTKYVRAGDVNYAGFKQTDLPALSAYLRSIEAVCGNDYDTWTREQKLAFWINAYNAYTVKLVLDHYPIRSIRSIGVLPGAAFRERFISLAHLRRRHLSLNDIEHGILRREFAEPRIHFAIVCASRSCPPLRSEAYRARDLEMQLDDNARSFIGDTTKNRFDPATRTLYLSPIFNWFREDFERSADLQEFVARHVDPSTARAIRSGNVHITFLNYDWSLNGR